MAVFMGWCHEFGPQIGAGCDHAMQAGHAQCECTACGVVCHGRFGGCASVWRRGPVKVVVTGPPQQARVATAAPAAASALTATPAPAAATARAPLPVAPAAMGDDFRVALDTVRADVAALHVAVKERQDAVVITDAMTLAADRLADLLDTVPARIRAAVEEGVARIQARPMAEVAPNQPELGPAVADVRRWASELHAELVRLAAFRQALADDMPALATALDSAASRAGDRLRTTTQSMEALGIEPPEPPEPSEPIESPEPIGSGQPPYDLDAGI
jgi:hypothetical protein